MRELTDFIKNALSQGAAESFARTSCAFLLYFLVVWETYLVSKTGTWHDIPANWLVLVLAIWGIGKTAETVQGIKGSAQ